MITTDRNEFLGAHVTVEVKEALRKEASRQQTNMSEYVFNLLTTDLRTKGYSLSEPKKRNGE